MVRIDMSRVHGAATRWRVSSARLRATSATRRAASSPRRSAAGRTAVVLFDEIEKAHPEVFNVLLQVLDDGRLTDSKGRAVDFKNTVIIMTSNVGSQFIHEYQQSMRSPADEEAMRKRVEEELHRHFRPEFLNRIDDIIVFHSLDLAQIKRIIEIQLRRLSKLIGDRGLTIEISDTAKDVARARRLRPGVRRAATQARAAEGDHRPAGDPPARRNVQAGRHRVREHARREAGAVAGAGSGERELIRSSVQGPRARTEQNVVFSEVEDGGPGALEV